jgi:hypothetical protein
VKTRNISLFCVTLLLFSCFGNRKKVVEETSSIPQEEEQVVFSVPVTEEQMRDFLYENDEYLKKRKLEITFISKANFGIPGGDNWIVRFSNNLLLVYMINDNGVEKRYVFASYDLEQESNFDIMRDIPGTRIGNSTSSIGDFNGDGIDEIFHFAFGGNEFLIIINSYDAEKDDFVHYCAISFKLIDRENGPAPVKFMTYNGMYGFKVYYFVYELGFSPTYHPDPSPRTNKWFFYTWDAEQRKYVEIEEVK